VHESLWEDPESHSREDAASYDEWEHIREVRDAILPFLEKKREDKQIGSSLDAKIYFKVKDKKSERILKKYLKELPRVFISSQVEWMEQDRDGTQETDASFPSLSLQAKLQLCIEKADGKKCVRCWNYSETVGTDSEHEGLCQKCLEAIRT